MACAGALAAAGAAVLAGRSSRLVPVGIPSNDGAPQSSRSLLVDGFESEQGTLFPLTLRLVSVHDSVMAGAGDAVTADAAMDELLVSPQGKIPTAEVKGALLLAYYFSAA